MTNPKVPFTLPLVFPLSLNDPVSVSPDTKHPELLLKVKFEMVSVPSPFTVNEVPKLKAVTLFESVKRGVPRAVDIGRLRVIRTATH